MPKFSPESFSKLSTCHLDLQALFFEVIKYFDCQVLDGYRNQQEQEDAYNAGNTSLHFPNGKHNSLPSMAVDVAPYPVVFANTQRAYWFAGFVMGLAVKLKDEGKMTHSLRWGGSWDGLGRFDTPAELKDLDHFELLL